LTSANGEEFFRKELKDCLLPVMVGTLISSTPAERPTVLVIGLSDPSSTEITLRMKDDSGNAASLNGPIMHGSKIQFEGVVRSFTKTPFMIYIEAFTIEVLPKFEKPIRR